MSAQWATSLLMDNASSVSHLVLRALELPRTVTLVMDQPEQNSFISRDAGLHVPLAQVLTLID